MMAARLLLITGIFFASAFYVYADVIYLKNGRSIEGIIKSENDVELELEVNMGSVKFQKNQIAQIKRTGKAEGALLRQEWQRQQQERINREERAPREVGFSEARGGIIVSCLIDDKVSATLLLDTGATVVMLRKNIAGQLNLDVGMMKPDMKVQLADGRQVNAKHIVITKLLVQDAEARNVDAAIILDEVASVQMPDGLLGLSFLKNFKYTIDHQANKLILEKF